MRPTKPEVLAPAGSLEALASAIAHGADAVYMGAGQLNARVRAGNLSTEQLPAVIQAVHRAGVRFHVPLNLPLQKENLDESLATLSALYLAGADVVILRDVHLMELCRKVLPDLAVHASTQAGVHNAATARRMEELGVRRAILARECSLDDIRAIRRECPRLELESFFFGALCFGVSGACLLGEAVGHRSGNYGNCLQACRLPYVDEEGEPLGHPFSMKDLDYFRRIRELVQAGIGSLKIEGRLKSPAWVGCVTAWARKAADKWSSGGLSDADYQQFDQEISTLFSRPRTDAFLDGKRRAEELIFPGAPGHRGQTLRHQTIAERNRMWISFRTPVELSVRDGLLLSYRGGGEEPVSIRELRDEQGRRVSLVAAGRVARVPVTRHVEAVAIHSCQAVKRTYEVAPLKLDDEAFPATVEHVVLTSDAVTLTGRLGRFKHEARFPLATQPARGEGFGPGQGKKLFAEASFDCEPGLFVPPSLLKQIRRQFREDFTRAYARALAQMSARLMDEASRMTITYQAPDAELLTKRPAAVARLTGMRDGTVRTTGGDRFEVETTAEGTVVRSSPKDRR